MLAASVTVEAVYKSASDAVKDTTWDGSDSLRFGSDVNTWEFVGNHAAEISRLRKHTERVDTR